MADSLFRKIGDGYVLAVPSHELELRAERLRWRDDDLKGELAVMCGILGGRAIDGCLSRSTYNFSSQRARDEHARSLAKRARTNQLPFADYLEEFSERIIRDQRDGLPAVLLRDIPMPGPDVEHSIDGWHLPAHDVAIAFGDAEAGKSLIGLYAGGRLAAQGVPTLYCDFEWNANPHRVRLARLFPDALPPLHYCKCDRPLVYEADRLRAYILKHGIAYAVFDSVGYACTGRPEDAEHALAYFRAARPLNIGSLHLAHVTKPGRADSAAERDQSYQRPFGSNFWHASARSTWFCKRADPDRDGPTAPLTLGLFHRKSNSGARYPALGFQFTFERDRVHVARVDPAAHVELGERLPLWQRMKGLLVNGALLTNKIAEQLDVPEASVRQVLKRDMDSAGRKGSTSMFKRVDGGLIVLCDQSGFKVP
ncbi:MAG: hypothetical protein AB7J35_22265 [Dehalococcoidia bacterium]